MVCCFFGHRDTPCEIQVDLQKLLVDLIENYQADKFYVGNQGGFDFMVRRTLELLKEKYSHIKYYVVLAYLPRKRGEFDLTDYSHTILPEGVGNIPAKFAILKRNRWMVDNSDTVITYIKYSFGGAAQFKELAEKCGKRVINLV